MADDSLVEIALAKIRLVRGAVCSATLSDRVAGNADEVVFHAGRPSRLFVGSDPSATLCIARAEVAPRQLDIVWDGRALWVQDALRLGRTFVYGRTLNEWTEVVKQAVVYFGGVQLWMVSRAQPSTRSAPDFAALEAACMADAYSSEGMRLSDTCRIVLPPELQQLINERGAP